MATTSNRAGTPLMGIPIHRPFQVYSDVQCHFLSRLYRLETIRKDLTAGSEGDPQTLRLISYAMYSTFRDCSEHGVSAEAREILNLGLSEEPVEAPRKKAQRKPARKARPAKRAA